MTQTENASRSISCDQALQDFMVYNRAARLTAMTLRYYRGQLTPFVNWCRANEVVHLELISPALIRSYLISLDDRGLSDHSVHVAARAIRAWLNFCVREEYISSSPMAKVAMPRVDKRVLPAFSDEDIELLLNACNSEREQALILFLLDTGCRASEVVGLNGADIDLGTGEVRIRRSKGRRERTVFLGAGAKASLAQFYSQLGTPAEDDPVWTSSTRGNRLTPSGLHQLLKRLGRRAGIPNCAPHTFRRTFALWSLRNGMDIFRLARLMGHADITVLRQYLHLQVEDLRAAHARFGVVDNLLGN